MENVMKYLEEIDTKEHHIKTLDNLLMVYLSSEEANCHNERVDIILLISILRRLFV